MRDFSWLGERYRRSFWFIRTGPEEEVVAEVDGVEMVAEDDASVILMSAEDSDVGITVAVDDRGSEVGVAMTAVSDVEACVIADTPCGTVSAVERVNEGVG